MQMAEDNLLECTPNAGKLVLGMRETAGYNPYTIMADIIDNSIDASATKIDIVIRNREHLPEIVTADNGIGMSMETLREAVRLGSNNEKDKMKDLGCFGMGMKVAAMAVGKQLMILTKETDGEWIKAILDIDKIVETDRWVVDCSKITEDEQKYIDEFLSTVNSGTIIVIKKLDKFSVTATTQVADTLKKHTSRIFWKKIVDGVKITINKQLIESYDPLEWEDWEVKKIAPTRIDSIDEILDVSYVDYDGKKKQGKIQLKCIAFAHPDEDPNFTIRDNKWGWEASNRNCGIYTYRNNRELSYGKTYDWFEKHSTSTVARIGIYFLADELDFAMGTSFNKTTFDGTKIQQSIRDVVSPIVKKFVSRVATATIKASIKSNAQNAQIVHDKVSVKVKRLSRALSLPLGKKEKRNSPVNHTGQLQSNTGVRSRKVGNVTQPGKMDTVVFRNANMGRDGLIYTVDDENNSIVITYNSEHPLYAKINENMDTLELFDHVILSLAQAEIVFMYNQRSSEDGFVEPLDIIGKFKGDMSNNLRVILNN